MNMRTPKSTVRYAFAGDTSYNLLHSNFLKYLYFLSSLLLVAGSIDSQEVHHDNYTNGYEEQQQEYVIKSNEKLYPLEIPVGSIMKLQGNKHLAQLLPKVGKTLQVTLQFCLDVENFYLDMEDESDELYNVPLEDMQLEINGADKNHTKITELPGEFVCFLLSLICLIDNLHAILDNLTTPLKGRMTYIFLST